MNINTGRSGQKHAANLSNRTRQCALWLTGKNFKGYSDHDLDLTMPNAKLI